MDGHLAELWGHILRAWPVLVLAGSGFVTVIRRINRLEVLVEASLSREKFRDEMVARDEMLERRYVPREALSERLKSIEDKIEEIRRLVKNL